MARKVWRQTPRREATALMLHLRECELAMVRACAHASSPPRTAPCSPLWQPVRWRSSCSRSTFPWDTASATTSCTSRTCRTSSWRRCLSSLRFDSSKLPSHRKRIPRSAERPWFTIRGAAVVYIAFVGIVFNTLLVGEDLSGIRRLACGSSRTPGHATLRS